MKLNAVSSLLVTSALGAALVAPAMAQGALAETVRHRDAARDVTVLPGPGLSPAHRRSIDLRRVVVRAGDDTVRFTAEIKKVVRRPRFDQMLFFDLTSPSPAPSGAGEEELRGQVAFTSKGRNGYAVAWAPGPAAEESLCVLRGVTIRWSRQAVSVDVPRRCVPSGEVRLRVESSTGTFRTDSGVWSRDRLRVPGRHVLRD